MRFQGLSLNGDSIPEIVIAIMKGKFTPISRWLKLAGAGLLVLGIALGATAAGVGAPGIGFEAFESAVVSAGSLGASSVALGLGAFGLLQMREAFGGNERDVGYGVLLLIMSLVGMGAAYRMARPVVTQWLSSAATLEDCDADAVPASRASTTTRAWLCPDRAGRVLRSTRIWLER